MKNFFIFAFIAQTIAGAPLQLGKHGTARELFVDNHLIAKLSGDLKQHLHHPAPKEVVLTTGAPWEGHDYGNPKTNFGYGRTFVAIDLKTKKIKWHLVHHTEERRPTGCGPRVQGHHQAAAQGADKVINR